MPKKRLLWKKGRGKLGLLEPLLGTWKAVADSPLGRVTCTKTFTPILGGAHIQLQAHWKYPKGTYSEVVIYGMNEDREVAFWSFTSDGKSSHGTIADVSDIHPKAIGFKARMPAGPARMAYWPEVDGGVRWAVEAKAKKGWRRITEHYYTLQQSAA